MQACPISYLEIEAYARLNSIEMLPWELRALRKIDEILLSSRPSKPAKGDKPEDREPDVLVSKADGAGVSSLMKGLAAKARKK